MKKKMKTVSKNKSKGRKAVKKASDYVVDKSNGLANGNGIKAVAKDELQAEILAAETEHPRIQLLLDIAEKNGVSFSSLPH